VCCARSDLSRATFDSVPHTAYVPRPWSLFAAIACPDDGQVCLRLTSSLVKTLMKGHAQGGIAKVSRSIEGSSVIVDAPYRGGDTRQIVAVAGADIVLVTDRNDVPADRLATYHPEWQPAARAAAGIK
jgi:hypothetical protein